MFHFSEKPPGWIQSPYPRLDLITLIPHPHPKQELKKACGNCLKNKSMCENPDDQYSSSCECSGGRCCLLTGSPQAVLLQMNRRGPQGRLPGPAPGSGVPADASDCMATYQP